MIVSFYHRLMGIFVAIAKQTETGELRPLSQEMQALMTQLCATGDAGAWEPTWRAEPLENAFLLLPLLLFYHEDPVYLGDRLRENHLPPGHLPLVIDLGQLLSACLREKITGETFGARCGTFSCFGTERQLYREQRETWRAFRSHVQGDRDNPTAQELHLIYGAIAYGRGHWQESLTLVAAESPRVKLWVAIFCGGLRGDRQLPLDFALRRDLAPIRQQVREFWSRWSGLPPQNQLHLDQLPLIANQSVLQYRPHLQLIAQRHLN